MLLCLISIFFFINRILDGHKTEETVQDEKNSRFSRIPAFVKWCDVNGIHLDQLGLEITSCQQDSSTDELCLRTTRPMNEQQLAFTVPRRLCMTTETAMRNPILSKYTNEIID